MKDWIMELCPEIAEWQAELIAGAAQECVEAEREACAKLCDEMAFDWQKYVTTPSGTIAACAAAIRSRGRS